MGLWNEKQLDTRRLLAYETTNFYTFIARNNEPDTLVQRGHNKQGRKNLRQVGLSYVLDGENDLSARDFIDSSILNILPSVIRRNQKQKVGFMLVAWTSNF